VACQYSGEGVRCDWVSVEPGVSVTTCNTNCNHYEGSNCKGIIIVIGYRIFYICRYSRSYDLTVLFFFIAVHHLVIKSLVAAPVLSQNSDQFVRAGNPVTERRVRSGNYHLS